MKVIAKETGFYGNERKKAGAVFEMKDEHYQPEGKEPCSWVKPHKKFLEAKAAKIEEGKAPADAEVEALHEDEEQDEQGAVAASVDKAEAKAESATAGKEAKAPAAGKAPKSNKKNK